MKEFGQKQRCIKFRTLMCLELQWPYMIFKKPLYIKLEKICSSALHFKLLLKCVVFVFTLDFYYDFTISPF